MEEANVFLRERYVAEFNRRFAVRTETSWQRICGVAAALGLRTTSRDEPDAEFLPGRGRTGLVDLFPRVEGSGAP
jgi:hypothetical protein